MRSASGGDAEVAVVPSVAVGQWTFNRDDTDFTLYRVVERDFVVFLVIIAEGPGHHAVMGFHRQREAVFSASPQHFREGVLGIHV